MYRTKDLEFQVAVGHIIEYITRDYFYDLEGSMEEFFNCIPQFCNTVQEILEEDGRLNSDGDLVASDEDENGNLKGIIICITIFIHFYYIITNFIIDLNIIASQILKILLLQKMMIVIMMAKIMKNNGKIKMMMIVTVMMKMKI